MDENTSESSSINGPEFDAQFASLKSDDVGDESAGDIPISSLSGLKGSIDENKSKSIFMSVLIWLQIVTNLDPILYRIFLEDGVHCALWCLYC